MSAIDFRVELVEDGLAVTLEAPGASIREVFEWKRSLKGRLPSTVHVVWPEQISSGISSKAGLGIKCNPSNVPQDTCYVSFWRWSESDIGDGLLTVKHTVEKFIEIPGIAEKLKEVVK